MSTLTDGMKAGATVAVLMTAAGLIYYGASSQGRTAVWATVLGDAQSQAGFDALGRVDGGPVVHGLEAPSDGGDRPAYLYARTRVCALPIDGGSDPGPSILPGVEIVYDDDDVGTCADTDPTLEVWAQGWHGPDGGGAPFLCACSTGADCTWTQTLKGGATSTGPAPLGNRMTAGTWSGPGCEPMTCTLMSGSPAWPAECPQ